MWRSAAASWTPPSGVNVRLVAMFSKSSMRSFSGDITEDTPGNCASRAAVSPAASTGASDGIRKATWLTTEPSVPPVVSPGSSTTSTS